MKKIQLKIKELEYSQHLFNYKSMLIVPDVQGHLTPQSLVRSGQRSNCIESWFWVLIASVPGLCIFFNFIQDFMVVLLTCKNEEDPLKIKCARVLTTFSHYKSINNFSDIQGHLTPQSVV